MAMISDEDSSVHSGSNMDDGAGDFSEASDGANSDGVADDEDELEVSDDENRPDDNEADDNYTRPTKTGRVRSLTGLRVPHRSFPSAKSKDPAAAAIRRVQRVASAVQTLLSNREDIKLEVLNRVILHLNKEERAALRVMGAMQQEHYVAARDTCSHVPEQQLLFSAQGDYTGRCLFP